MFSVCKDVDATFLSDETDAVCDATALGQAPAYQYIKNEASPADSMCEKMGESFENDLNYRWSVHDQEDPAAGVVLTYLNGDSCTGGVKRSFELHFICRDDKVRSKNIPTEEFVEEEELCVYKMNIFTGYGCPTECPRSGELEEICGGYGVCGYDAITSKARCFCDDGRKGDACDESGSSASASSGGSSSHGGLVAALVIMCLLLVGVVGLVVYMWLKLRKLQLDPDAYSQLGNRFNELGQVSESA